MNATGTVTGDDGTRSFAIAANPDFPGARQPVYSREGSQNAASDRSSLAISPTSFSPLPRALQWEREVLDLFAGAAVS
jgi:hypothetical protein